jgi:hypothetical protein
MVSIYAAAQILAQMTQEKVNILLADNVGKVVTKEKE